MTSTTGDGVPMTTENDSLSLDNAADAFLARFLPEGEDASKKKPSEKTDETKDTSETDDQDEPETSDDEESPDEGDDDQSEKDQKDKGEDKKYVDSDDVFVKVKVGEEEVEASVKDLKRLYGQEAALTRRSQEFAEQRKKVEADAQRYAAGLDVMSKRAEARANQYRQIDWMALARDPNVNQEQLGLLQAEAQRALEEEAFIKNEVGTFVQAVNQQQQQSMAAQARETVKALGDQASPLYIEGWNQKVYNDILTFAVQEGLPKDIVHNLVDASAIKLLHMAMMYKKGASKVTTQRVNKTPKKIVKTSNSSVAQQTGTPAKQKQAMQRLRQKGSLDNAADAFLANWEAMDK